MEKDVFYYIDGMIQYAIDSCLIEEVDRVYFVNKLIKLLKLDEYKCSNSSDKLDLEEMLDFFLDYAVKNNLIEDTQSSKDLYDTELMSLFCDKPSNVISTFNEKYACDKKSATDWFYKYSMDVNYIRTHRIKKDIKWKTQTKYGLLDITINLSKPEKDPKDIMRAREIKKANYPLCALCKENEGYAGRIDHPARGNLRLIPIKLDNQNYYLQYSPYSYYNEHAIILSEVHSPMVINKSTFKKLFDFLDLFPHYFVGSNADLGIVGGSILSHDHFQGGRFTFPMDVASIVYEKDAGDINVSLLYWPLSCIRLKGKNRDKIIDLSDKILKSWIDYSNVDLGIINYTDGERHNTITPISRYENGEYIMDLVLRCNIQTLDRPYGVFHPSEKYHHIKKENIGLIEVLGLAILPSRLKNELEEVKNYLLNGGELSKDIEKHKDWISEMQRKYSFTKDNVKDIIKDEVGNIYALLLEDCGVFKQDEKGQKAFIGFLNGVLDN